METIKNTLKKWLGLGIYSVDDKLIRIQDKIKQIREDIKKLGWNLKETSLQLTRIDENLSEIQKSSLRKTGKGKIMIEDLETTVNRLETLVQKWKDTKESFYQDRIKLQFESVSSKIEYYKQEIQNIPFDAAGLTVMGIILAFFPVVQILSLLIGIYLLFKSDWRAKISGAVMIVLILIIIVVHLVI
ncbi:MAG: hypothetical protein ACTSRW_08470 [Candidatus Helarchaeota archaeon]